MPSPETFYAFLLVGARTGGLLTASPVVGNQTVPKQVLAGFALMLSLAITPIAARTVVHLPSSLLELGFNVLVNGVVGIIIGFATRLLLTAVNMAGYFIDTQIGFGFANLINPFANEQSSILSTFQYQLALTLFMLMNGPLYMIATLVRSFKDIPLNGNMHLVLNGMAAVPMMSIMMVMCIRLALPVFAVLSMCDLAFGLIARMAPQLNVYIVGMPAKVIIGLTTMALMLPVLALVVGQIITGTNNGLSAVFGGSG